VAGPGPVSASHAALPPRRPPSRRRSAPPPPLLRFSSPAAALASAGPRGASLACGATAAPGTGRDATRDNLLLAQAEPNRRPPTHRAARAAPRPPLPQQGGRAATPGPPGPKADRNKAEMPWGGGAPGAGAGAGRRDPAPGGPPRAGAGGVARAGGRGGGMLRAGAPPGRQSPPPGARRPPAPEAPDADSDAAAQSSRLGQMLRERRAGPGRKVSAPRGAKGKSAKMRQFAMEVGSSVSAMDSMRAAMEGVGAELLDDVKWAYVKRQVAVEDEWRPQVSLLVAMGFKVPDLERLVDARDDIMVFKPAGLKEKLDFLRTELGLSPEEVRKLVLKCPRILEYKPARTIVPRLEWLHEDLKVPRKEFKKIVLRAPQFMSLSLEESLKPRAEFVRGVVGGDPARMEKVLRKHPDVLTYTEQSMQKRVEFMTGESVGMSPEQVARAVAAHPQVLHYRIPAMKRRVDYLAGLGLSAEHVASVLSTMPQIFSLDVEANMRPKVQYLTAQMGATSETLVKYPGILSLSLANRIVPRHKFMEEVGYPIIHPLPPNLLKCSDSDFSAKLGVSIEEYEEFKNRVAARLATEGLP